MTHHCKGQTRPLDLILCQIYCLMSSVAITNLCTVETPHNRMAGEKKNLSSEQNFDFREIKIHEKQAGGIFKSLELKQISVLKQFYSRGFHCYYSSTIGKTPTLDSPAVLEGRLARETLWTTALPASASFSPDAGPCEAAIAIPCLRDSRIKTNKHSKIKAKQKQQQQPNKTNKTNRNKRTHEKKGQCKRLSVSRPMFNMSQERFYKY